jgi:phage terminase large subunit-like protein
MTQNPSPSPKLERLQEQDIKGHTVPRIWTPPLRELTPDTSYGFAVIEFARDFLHEPLDPWQEWLVIHIGELLPDGRPRFKQALIIVARQNGKTHLLRILALFWLFWEQWELILGTSTNLSVAREAWDKAVQTAETNPVLRQWMPPKGVRRANGEQTLSALRDDGPNGRYLIAASNRRGGRGLTIDRLILDELREHRSWEAWNAATPATNARPHAQIIAITNQGDDESVVLDSLRDAAIKDIEQETSHLSREGIFEWSVPDGSDISDPNIWAYANPNLGYRLDLDSIRGPALRALEAGGTEEAGFRTEMLCQRVRSLDAAFNARAWVNSYRTGVVDPTGIHVWGFDVNRAGTRATLVAAQIQDGKTRVQVISEWRQEELQHVTTDLIRLLKHRKPKAMYWFPNGPAATYGAQLKNLKIPGVRIEELRGEISDAHMGFAEAVQQERILHDNDPLLTDHVTGAQKLWTGDAWKYSRKGKGNVDAAYAAAAAWMGIHTMPPVPGPLRLVGPDDDEEA